MSDSSEFREPRLFDGFSRLCVAAATAALAVCAQRWAVDGFPTSSVVLPVEVAAVAGLSFLLARANLPLLVRVALHLGAFWLLLETLGQAWIGPVRCGLFFVSTAAFSGGIAVARLTGYLGPGATSDDRRRRLTTGDSLAALFAFSAYVAIGQQQATSLGPETFSIAESAVPHALLPYVVLIAAERLIGRRIASVALCLAAVVIALTFPSGSAIDPFAIVLIVALRAVARPFAIGIERESDPDRPLVLHRRTVNGPAA